MNSCLEFAENIQENIQITSDNPVILEDAKFWIVTQVQKIKASWWPHKNQISPGISWLSNAYAPYILENLSESSFVAVENWVESVNYTDKKLMDFIQSLKLLIEVSSSGSFVALQNNGK